MMKNVNMLNLNKCHFEILSDYKYWFAQNIDLEIVLHFENLEDDFQEKLKKQGFTKEENKYGNIALYEHFPVKKKINICIEDINKLDGIINDISTIINTYIENYSSKIDNAFKEDEDKKNK